MSVRRLTAAVALALVLPACRPHDDAAPTPDAPLFRSGALPLADCGVVHADHDVDGLDSLCEDALASIFAPVLMQHPDDCQWTHVAATSLRPDFEGIAGGYLYAVQRRAPDRLRLAYLPAYVTDCGWHGAKCILPGVRCDAHAGDSEFIVIDVEAEAGRWQPAAVFLSAHCFEGRAGDCRWYRHGDLSQLDWDGARPVVWVSKGRHANYPSEAACERGHYRLDTCAGDAVAVRFPVEAPIGNIGSASSATPPCRRRPPLAHGADPGASECLWSSQAFRGWHADAPGVTPYLRYLDEIAGFVTPIDRLAWMAGCWARRDGASLTEEQWMAPRGGTMLGMGRVVRAGETVDSEAMRIEARGDSLVFVANPNGQTEAEFPASAIGDDRVVFENPAHDFPQRIIYRHAAGDSLHARIEGLRDGAERGIDFRMGRTQCGP